MESLTGPCGLMSLTFPPLQDVIDLEARVIDLCIPLGWHNFWESPAVATNSYCKLNTTLATWPGSPPLSLEAEKRSLRFTLGFVGLAPASKGSI